MLLDRFKIARVDSALKPSISGKPMTIPPPAKKSFVSSLGDRVRSETSSALEQGLKMGALTALACFGMKVAKGMAMAIPEWHSDLMFAHHGSPGGAQATAAPTAPTRPSTSWADFNRGAQQHVADAANTGAIAMQPRATKATQLAPHLGAPPAIPPSHAPPVPGAAMPAAGATSKFHLPSMGGAKGALGLAALGALGAGAYGLHKQHVRDLEGERLTYAPMQGGLY